jgi:hypothetical protein
MCDIQGVIQRMAMWQLILLEACLEEEDCVRIRD